MLQPPLTPPIELRHKFRSPLFLNEKIFTQKHFNLFQVNKNIYWFVPERVRLMLYFYVCDL